jgi:ABC-type uncharacterized transport system ATPase component
MSLMRFDRISFRYPHSERAIISDFSLSLQPGEIVAILGQNGTGKSTLFKLALNDLPLSKGSVFFKDRSISSYTKKEFFQNIISVNQRIDRSLFVDLTLQENLRIWKYRFEISTPLQEYMEALLCYEHLKDSMNQRVSHLSGGEQQIFLSSLIFSLSPSLLFLDEHTSQLDLHNSKTIMSDMLKYARQNHTAIMMITHNLQDALIYSDRMIIMRYDAPPLEYISTQTTLEAIKSALL